MPFYSGIYQPGHVGVQARDRYDGMYVSFPVGRRTAIRFVMGKKKQNCAASRDEPFFFLDSRVSRKITRPESPSVAGSLARVGFLHFSLADTTSRCE